ncbi:hypothetical protein FIU92_07835 [Ruegeria sp. THAF33]|nr:hypothetical protein FIU92_07835 [Ruegeria sp. THAF33]
MLKGKKGGNSSVNLTFLRKNLGEAATIQALNAQIRDGVA